MVVTGNSFQVFPIWLGDSYCQPVWWNDRGWFFSHCSKVFQQDPRLKFSLAPHLGKQAMQRRSWPRGVFFSHAFAVTQAMPVMPGELKQQKHVTQNQSQVTRKSLNITEVSTSVYLVHLLYPIFC